MKWDRAVRWIMIVAGALTFTMVSAAFAPHESLQKNFGATLEGPIAEIVVRNWGALIALVGVMLFWGALDRAARPLALVVGGVSKMIFIGLLLTYGRQFLDGPIRVAVVVDAIMIVLFAICLFAGRPRVAHGFS